MFIVGILFESQARFGRAEIRVDFGSSSVRASEPRRK